jgi:hypothetical protein
VSLRARCIAGVAKRLRTGQENRPTHSPDSCNIMYGKPACGMESSNHELIGIFDVFLELLNGFPLGHDLGIFKQLSQPNLSLFQ